MFYTAFLTVVRDINFDFSVYLYSIKIPEISMSKHTIRLVNEPSEIRVTKYHNSAYLLRKHTVLVKYLNSLLRGHFGINWSRRTLLCANIPFHHGSSFALNAKTIHVCPEDKFIVPLFFTHVT